jgi:DNA invertase Pin-like site-specific DNA recombinase
MKCGYARVSADDQKADPQRAALKSCPDAKRFSLTTGTIKRPALLRYLKTLKAGDTLIV